MKNKSLKINAVMNALLTMSSFIFQMISFPYASRILLPEGMGKSSFAVSIISYLVLFSQLGIPTYGVVVCSKFRKDKEELTRNVHELFFINLIMSLLGYIVLVILLISIPKLSQDKPLYIIASFVIILNALGMEWLYKALEEYSYITIRSIVFKVVALILMLVTVKSVDDYILYTAITVFATGASQILNLVHLRKFIIIRPIGGYKISKHWKAILIFFAMSCATTIYTHLDSVMLGFMKTDEIVGFYNTAVKIKFFLVSIVASVGTVLLPRATFYIKNNEYEKFEQISYNTLNFVFLIGTAVSCFFFLFAEDSILLLSGKEYVKSVLPMQIVMPTVFLIGMTNIMGIQMLVPLGKEKIVLASEIVGAIVNLVFNILLIPAFDASGAAFGTLLAESGVFLVQAYFLKEYLVNAFKGFPLIGYLLILSLSSSLSTIIHAVKLNYFWTIVGGGLIFVGPLLIWGYLNGMLGKLIKRNNKR